MLVKPVTAHMLILAQPLGWGWEQATRGEGRLPKPSSSRYILSFSLAMITVICLREILNLWKKIAV